MNILLPIVSFVVVISLFLVAAIGEVSGFEALLTFKLLCWAIKSISMCCISTVGTKVVLGFFVTGIAVVVLFPILSFVFAFRLWNIMMFMM